MEFHRVLVFVLSLLRVFLAANGQQDQICSPYNCYLPGCYCSGSKIPGSIGLRETPQIVTVTFQGAVTEKTMDEYRSLISGRQNPNKCPYSSTFFVQEEYTKFQVVQQLFLEKQEIALFGGHSSLHEPKYARDWFNQVMRLKRRINEQAGVPMEYLNGYRLFGGWAPGGDEQYNALQAARLTYDSSLKCPNVGFWPYTLDYKTTQRCPVPVCPSRPHRGFWEVPMSYFYDRHSFPCAEMDSCRGVKNEGDAFNLLLNNFYQHYTSNRAPFPMFFHQTWFQRYNYTLQAVLDFMEVISRMEDVYVLSMNKTIEWVKKPTPLSSIKKFQPWSC